MESGAGGIRIIIGVVSVAGIEEAQVEQVKRCGQLDSQLDDPHF